MGLRYLFLICTILMLFGCSFMHIYDKARDDESQKLLEEVGALDLRSVVVEARANRSKVFESFITDAEKHNQVLRDTVLFNYASGKKPLGELRNDINKIANEIIINEEKDDKFLTYRYAYNKNSDLKREAAALSVLSLHDFVDFIRKSALDLAHDAGVIEQTFGVSGLECRVVPLDLLPVENPESIVDRLNELKPKVSETLVLPDKPIEGCEGGTEEKRPKDQITISNEKEFFHLAGLKRPQELVKLAPQKLKKNGSSSCEDPLREGFLQSLKDGNGLNIPKNENRVENAARFAKFYTTNYATKCADKRITVLKGLTVLQKAGLKHGLLDPKLFNICDSSLPQRIEIGASLQNSLIFDNCIARKIEDEQTDAQVAQQAFKAAEDSLKKATKKSDENSEKDKKTISDYLAMVTKSMNDLNKTSSMFGQELLREKEVTALELATNYLKNKTGEEIEGNEDDLPLELRQALAVAKGIPKLEAALDGVAKSRAPALVALEAEKAKASVLKEHATKRVVIRKSEREALRIFKDNAMEALLLLDLAAEKYACVTKKGLEKSTLSIVLADKELPYQDKEDVMTALISMANAGSLFASARDRMDYNLIALESDRSLLADEMKAVSHQDLIVIPARTLSAWYASGLKPDTVAQILVNAIGFSAIAIQLD
jgi:hypothetical protein